MSEFSPEMFKFLRALKKNNERDWFNDNKPRYVEHIKEASIDFIVAMEPKLAIVSDAFLADPRPVGGSLFRIYNDQRFGKGKPPYKTHVGIHFKHKRGKDVHAPGFYLHMDPKECFLGAGIWHPETKVANKVRQAIVDDGKTWKKITGAKKFKSRYELSGDSLKRAPKGFDVDHPMIEDIRRKDFIAVSNFDPKKVTQPGFSKFVAAEFKAAGDFVEFICDAMGLEF